MRQHYVLTEEEYAQFLKLQPVPNHAWGFWRRVAIAREVDYKSIISNGRRFTALPYGHDKWWCFPSPLKCPKPPPEDDE